MYQRIATIYIIQESRTTMNEQGHYRNIGQSILCMLWQKLKHNNNDEKKTTREKKNGTKFIHKMKFHMKASSLYTHLCELFRMHE